MSPAREYAATALSTLAEAVKLGRRTGEGRMSRDLAAVHRHLEDVLAGAVRPARQDEGGLLARRPVKVADGLLAGERLD